MDTRESFISSENQEIRQQTPEKSSKIGEKVSSVNERMNKNPFSTLDDKTIQAIINTPNAHKIDVQTAKEEAKLREDEGRFDPESSDADIKQDLKDNYFEVNDGRFLVPTDEYKNYREGIKHGEEQDIMRGVVRETVEERQKRLNEQEAAQNPEQKKELADFRSEIEEYFRDEEHRKKAIENADVLKYYPETQAIQILTKRIADINKFVGMEKKHNEIAAQECYRSLLENELAGDIVSGGKLDSQEIKEKYLQDCAKFAVKNHKTGSHERQHYLQAVDLYTDIAKNSQNAKEALSPLQNLEADAKKNALESAILYNLANGSFLPNTSKNDPETVKQYLAENKISPKSLHSGLLEYICKTKNNDLDEELVYAYDDILDAKSALVEGYTLSDNHFSSGLMNKLIFTYNKSEPGKLRSDRLEKISAPAAEIINRKTDEIVEKVLNSESYSESIESAKEQAGSIVTRDIKQRLNTTIAGREQDNKESIDALTAITKADASRFFELDRYMPVQKYTDRFIRLVRNSLPPIETEIDSKAIIREDVIDKYQGGEFWRYKFLPFDIPLFGSEKFKEFAEKIDMSSSEIESIDNAIFNKFISELEKVNGEYSSKTDRYYSLFADNPEHFITKLNTFREDNCPRGLKAKIARFLKHNEEYQAYIQQKKAMEELGLNETESYNRTILEATSYEEVQKAIDERRKELMAELEAKSEDINTTFERETRGSQEEQSEGRRNGRRREKPLDFGVEKLSELNRWSLYLENNIDPDTRHFMRRFDNGSDKLKALEDPNTYHAITFEYGGKLCSIAESFSNDSSAMFVARAERDMAPEELVESMFESTKTDARERTDIGIERFYHYEDGLDSLYQKAFAYLKTGQRASNIQEAQENGNRLFGDMEEMGKISKNELPPQYPFI